MCAFNQWNRWEVFVYLLFKPRRLVCMEMNAFIFVPACFLQLFTRWEEGVYQSCIQRGLFFFYWIWQRFSLKLIYGQYPELIPGIHLEFIQRLHQQSQFQLIMMMWYLGNATLCPCHLQSSWTRCAAGHFNTKLVSCVRTVLLNWLLHIHWTDLWPVSISLSYTQGKKTNSCISQKC